MTEEENQQKKFEAFIDKLFSLSKEKIYLFGILLLGILLRLIAAINQSPSADSMHFVTEAINFLSAKRMTTFGQSSGLWHALTSIFYNIFGITHFATTFAAFIFGSASIIVIYLLVNEFFSKKIALLSAFLLAIAPFHIKNTSAEMDVMAMFFVLCAMFFFVKATKNEKPLFYLISGVFLGLAIYTKVYPLLFIPSLLFYQFYVNYKKSRRFYFPAQNKLLFLFLLGIFVFAIPVLTHNYLLYKEKGFVDFIFTKTFGWGKEISEKFYSWDPGWKAPLDLKGFFFGNASPIHVGEDKSPIFFIILERLFFVSPLIIFFGLLGFFAVLFVKKYRSFYNSFLFFFLFSIMFIFPYLGSSIVLLKHFLFLEILFIPFCALTLNFFINKLLSLNLVKSHKNTYLILGAILLILTLIFLGTSPSGTFPHYYGKGYTTTMIEMKDSVIPKDALIIADSRIYRGQIYWIFYGRPFFEASEFLSLYANQNNLSGKTINVETYYIECVIDDCGWGTIKNQPDFNQTMENIADAFINVSQLVASVYEPDRTKETYYPFIKDGSKAEILRIYKTTLPIKEPILERAYYPRNWFMYYVGYPNPSKEFDSYSPSGFFDTTLDKLAHLIVLLAVFLALISPIFVILYFLAIGDIK